MVKNCKSAFFAFLPPGGLTSGISSNVARGNEDPGHEVTTRVWVITLRKIVLYICFFTPLFWCQKMVFPGENTLIKKKWSRVKPKVVVKKSNAIIKQTIFGHSIEFFVNSCLRTLCWEILHMLVENLTINL